MIHRLRNPEARIEALEKRLAQNPTSAAFFPLASLLWAKGRAERAEDLLRSGLVLHPAYSAAGVLLAEILLSKNEHEEALRFVEEALTIAPWNASGQRLLADCLQKRGDEAKAQEALRAATMFAVDEVAAQNTVGEPGVASMGGPATRVEPMATPSLADLYMAQGHLDKARDIYMRLLESDPGHVEWNARLADIRERMTQAGSGKEPAGYPGIEENLGLLAGEVESVVGKKGGVALENARADATDAEPVDAEPAREPPLGEEHVGREGGDAPGAVLARIIEMYIREGNDAQALDVCRKAQILGHRTSWISEQIAVLEQRAGQSTPSLLRDEPKDDKDEAIPVVGFAEKTIETLEGWLETLRRRKANV